MLRKFNVIVVADQNLGNVWIKDKFPFQFNVIIDHNLDREDVFDFDAPKSIVVIMDKKSEYSGDVTICHTLLDTIKLSSDIKYVSSDNDIYNEILDKYAYLCNKTIIARLDEDHKCDKFIPIDRIDISNKEVTEHINSTGKYQLWKIPMNYVHPEQQYLDHLIKIMTEGESRPDRTGTGTKSLFGLQMSFDLRKGFPLLTTKRTWFEGIKKELLFFLSGKTDTKLLEAQGVNIWKGNTSTEFLQKKNLSWREGDMGPGYSYQWRHAGANYTGCDSDYTGMGIDQIKNLIEGIKTDPFSRRHIISSWDVVNIHLMALPPCHCLAQFYVGCEESLPTYLDCCLYQRSADMFLGVPFNIASYALLMEIIAHITGLIPRNFIHILGDAHIYTNHMDQVTEQIKRISYPFPSIKFTRTITEIDDLQSTDIVLNDYYCHQKLKGDMAI